jgi:hypothetical protein
MDIDESGEKAPPPSFAPPAVSPPGVNTGGDSEKFKSDFDISMRAVYL